jgi:hypothetical protein
MDIARYLEAFPELEDKCKDLLRDKYIEMLGSEPRPELETYVITIGIKTESTRAEVLEYFRVLFREKTEELV